MSGAPPSFDVSGRSVLVTGGTKGIGAMLASGFISAGATVFISARSAEDCKSVAHDLGPRAIPLPADLSTPAGVRCLAENLAEHVDSLDVLINNAGTTWGADLEQYPDDGWDKVLTLNLKAPFQLVVACLPALRSAVVARGTARVINIGSVDGLFVPRWESYAYSASKAGLHHLTRHLAKRLAPERITVNAIAPGIFESRMTSRAFVPGEFQELHDGNPLGRNGRAEDVAGAAIYLASPATDWVTGVVLPIDGGWGTLR
ncbi:SDR family oxidoreductase [Micromonospora sp. RTGN7]|uniref:SDR family oxidoreductase n=1 Tax=Micromonospora sp. RTGN7 TaxID=3016526 RepID=UPI0029FF33D5|nr:SDR family oxidoreductase [Micromonospora sp. RTGN7]